MKSLLTLAFATSMAFAAPAPGMFTKEFKGLEWGQSVEGVKNQLKEQASCVGPHGNVLSCDFSGRGRATLTFSKKGLSAATMVYYRKSIKDASKEYQALKKHTKKLLGPCKTAKNTSYEHCVWYTQKMIGEVKLVTDGSNSYSINIGPRP